MALTVDTLVLSPDDVETDAGKCPECGQRWTDDGVMHSHECRYYLLDDFESADDDFASQDLNPPPEFPAGASSSAKDVRPAA
jgi:hypothetical protein